MKPWHKVRRTRLVSARRVWDVIANLKALKKGIKEVQCMHANITTFRTEVKTWLANQKVHIACLQETHLPEEKLQEVATSPGWNGLPNLV